MNEIIALLSIGIVLYVGIFIPIEISSKLSSISHTLNEMRENQERAIRELKEIILALDSFKEAR